MNQDYVNVVLWCKVIGWKKLHMSKQISKKYDFCDCGWYGGDGDKMYNFPHYVSVNGTKVFKYTILMCLCPVVTNTFVIYCDNS